MKLKSRPLSGQTTFLASRKSLRKKREISQEPNIFKHKAWYKLVIFFLVNLNIYIEPFFFKSVNEVENTNRKWDYQFFYFQTLAWKLLRYQNTFV